MTGGRSADDDATAAAEEAAPCGSDSIEVL